MNAKESGNGSGSRRGRRTYTQACDVCVRKKIKCDGIKPVCQPCKYQGGQNKCTWTKNPVRKPRTEQHFEALRKHAENLIVCVEEYHRYADYLESLLDQCYQNYHHHQTVDFRASRPSEFDGLVSDLVEPLDDDFDFTAMSVDDDGMSRDTENPTKETYAPTQSLKIEETGLVDEGPTVPLIYDHLELFNEPSQFPTVADNPNGRYVLLLDGVSDDQNCNPDLDWSRNLPDSVPLDRKSHDRALDLLFKFFTSWCFSIVPDLLLRDMYQALSVPASQPAPKTPHYSPMLHNALIALALALLDEHRFKELETRKCYANKAKNLIEAECQKPNLSVVNALSILASFHSSQGEQNLGYLYFGMSVRMSQALGLSLDLSEWVKHSILEEGPDRLVRHWTNWSTFAQDACWAHFVGRDFCIASPSGAELGKDVALPPVDQEYDQVPWVYTPSGFDPQPNYLTSTFSATCELLLISRRITDVVNGLGTAKRQRFAVDDLISDIDGKLNSWKAALPLELELTIASRRTATPHKLMLHLTYWWLFILLHRPFFHRKVRPINSTDKGIDHVKFCRRAAENIMEILATWHSLYSLRYCPTTLVQAAFSAGAVYLLTAVQATSGIHIAQKLFRYSMEQQQLIMTYLHEIGKSWEHATITANILRGLMQEQLKPLLERRTTPARRFTSQLNSGDLQTPELTGQEGDDKGKGPNAHSPLPSTSNRSESGGSDSFPQSWTHFNKRAARLQTSRRSSISSDSPGTVYSLASSRTGSVDYGIYYTRRAFSLEPSPQNQA